MSFSISFTAKQAEVKERINSEQAPEAVKKFVRTAVEQLEDPEQQVRVVAYGHMTDAQQQGSSDATIKVEPLAKDQAAKS